MKKFKVSSQSLNLIVIVILTVVVLTFLIGNIFVATCAAESNKPQREDKVYDRTTLEDDFDDSSVFVVMDKHVSKINKTYDDKFFGNFQKEKQFFIWTAAIVKEYYK